MTELRNKSKYIERAMEILGDDYTVDVYKENNIKYIKIIHSECNTEVVRNYNNFIRSTRYSCECFDKNERIDKVKKILGEEYSVVDIIKKDNVQYATIIHKCGNEVTINYKNLISKGFNCNCVKNNNKIQRYQDKIDNYFGAGRMTILKFENSRINNTSIQFNKCGHIVDNINLYALMKCKSTYDCPICNSNSGVLKSIDDILPSLLTKFKGRISYISGYVNQESECIFKFNKCGHKFKTSIRRLKNIRIPDNFRCEECESLVEYNKKLIQNSLLPIYEVYKEVDTGHVYNVRCKICGTEQFSRRVSDINKALTPRCDCERNIQENIVNNLIDIEFLGKTEKVSPYMNLENLKSIQLQRRITFTINKSMYPDLKDTYRKYYKMISSTRSLKLPFDKIDIVMSDNNFTVSHNADQKFYIRRIFAEKLDSFNVNTLVYVEYGNSIGEFSISCYFRNDKPGTIIRQKPHRNESSVICNMAINIIQYLTNLHDNEKTIKLSYEKESLYNKKFNNKTGIIEHRTIYKNMRTKYIYIKKTGVKKRTIEACFDVSGHYMHFKKTGTKTFREKYTKGEQYRHIRRIEKDYMVK